MADTTTDNDVDLGLENQQRTCCRLSQHQKPHLRRRRLRRMGRALQNQRSRYLRSCLPRSLHAQHAYSPFEKRVGAFPP